MYLYLEFQSSFKSETMLQKLYKYLNEKQKHLTLRRKGQSLNTLTAAALGLGMMAIVITVILILLTTFQTNVNNTSTAFTVIGQFITGIGLFGTYIGIVVLVIIFGLLITILYKLLGPAIFGTGRGE